MLNLKEQNWGIREVTGLEILNNRLLKLLILYIHNIA